MKRFLLSMMGVAMLLLTSCSKKAENLKLIPKDATAVISFDVESLYKKADVKELQTLKTFQEIKANMRKSNEDLGSLVDEVLNDPKSSGIDTKKNVYAFVVLDMRAEPTVGVSMALDSDSKFKDFVAKIYKIDGREVDIETVDGRKLIQLHSDACLSWDGDKALLLFGSGSNNYKELSKKYFSLEKDDRIAKVDGFDDFLSGEKDINFWINFEPIMGNLPTGLLGMTYQSLMNLQKDMRMYAFVDFGKENIKCTSTVIYGEEYAKLMKKHNVYDATFNKDILAYFPEKMSFELGVAMNFKNYYELLKTQFAKFINEKQIDNELAKIGLTQDNIRNFLGGSFVFGLTGFENQTVTTSSLQYNEETDDYDWVEGEVQRLQPIMSVVFDLKDKTLIDKLFENADLQSLPKENGYYNLKKVLNTQAYFAYTDKMLIFTNSESQAQSFVQGGVANNAVNSAFATEVSKNLMYAKLDLNEANYPEELRKMLTDELYSDIEKGTYLLFAKLSDNIEMRRLNDTSAEFVYNVKGVEKNIINSLFKELDKLLSE